MDKTHHRRIERVDGRSWQIAHAPRRVGLSLPCTDKERSPRIEKVNDRLFCGSSRPFQLMGKERGRGRKWYRRGEDVVAEDLSIESFHRG
jgi:hypothetical protein